MTKEVANYWGDVISNLSSFPRPGYAVDIFQADGLKQSYAKARSGNLEPVIPSVAEGS